MLLSALAEGIGEDEHWAAVQCLVCAGQQSAAIISDLLHHLLDNYRPTKQARAEELLARISYKTVRLYYLIYRSSFTLVLVVHFQVQDLVNTMIADLLNNSDWRARLAACKTLAKLHKNINKDLCDKLLVCAWEDWRPAVRLAAAQTLGQSSHGKVRERINIASSYLLNYLYLITYLIIYLITYLITYFLLSYFNYCDWLADAR